MGTISRVVVHGEILNAVQVRNMFTGDCTLNEGDTDSEVWTAYISHIYTPLMSLLAPVCFFTQFELFNKVGTNWILIDTVAMANQGTAATDPNPNQVALTLIAKCLGLRKMGRKFFSGIALGDVVGNELTSAALAVATTVLANWILPYTSEGGSILRPGIVDAAWNFHAFIGGTVSSYLGSMRRRKPGVGI